MTQKMVTAKVFRVGCAPSVEQIDASLWGLQKIVGGFIEGITLEPGYILYCNEDGRAKGLPPNPQLPNNVVVLGDAVLVLHDSDGEAISMTNAWHEPEAIRKAIRRFAEEESHEKHTPTPAQALSVLAANEFSGDSRPRPKDCPHYRLQCECYHRLEEERDALLDAMDLARRVTSQDAKAVLDKAIAGRREGAKQ